MFRMSKKTEYAVQAVFHLSYRDGICTTEEIAKSQGIPKAFLKKIIQSLRAAGLIVSAKGQKGGVSLRVSPEKLTVKEVIEKVEGPLCICESLQKDGSQEKGNDPLGEIWQKCQQTLSEVLSAHRFSDLVKRYKELLDKKGGEGVPTLSPVSAFGFVPAVG